MKPKTFCAVCLSLIFIFSGCVVLFTSGLILKFLISTNLVLTPGSHTYNLWKHFPTLVPMDFYLFNWTNPEEIYNVSVKPKFQEIGPYRFMVDLGKNNITWNNNGTVTYRPSKYYFYDEEGTKRDLQDKITCPNPVALSAAHASRTWSYVVRKGLSLSLKGIAPTIHITRTVDELLFTGYPDTLTKIANTFPFFVGKGMPSWDKFAWFYKRNGTSGHDGVLNVGTGINSDFAKVYSWNYWTKSPYYTDVCAEIDGSAAGENFGPNTLGQFIKVFSTDLCRPVLLQYFGKTQVGGIMGRKYIFGDYMLDNGTKYPDTKCLCNGDCLPSGVLNVSSSRYGSPAFVSLPHFYNADPYYNSLIEGTRPEKGKHDFYVVIEPNTGIPLQVRIRFQLNLMLHSIADVTLYEGVPKVFVPALWFDHQINIPDSEIPTIKLLLKVPLICGSVGIFMIIVGVILLVYLILQNTRSVPQREQVLPKRNSGSTTERKNQEESSLL